MMSAWRKLSLMGAKHDPEHMRVSGTVPVVRKKKKKSALAHWVDFGHFGWGIWGREVSHWIHRDLEIQIDGSSAQEVESRPISDHSSSHFGDFPNRHSDQQQHICLHFDSIGQIASI